ncbi:hypothetical protein M9458_045785 [Cirrhinus mrigala]|uniref:Uncharacterized protein n=1 Tax=Cirrhinus mrigala TaxID=683832 RepID=A0ABD0N6F2_CIRMR
MCVLNVVSQHCLCIWGREHGTYQSVMGQNHNHYSMSTVSPVTQHALSPRTQTASPETQQR